MNNGFTLFAKACLSEYLRVNTVYEFYDCV